MCVSLSLHLCVPMMLMYVAYRADVRPDLLSFALYEPQLPGESPQGKFDQLPLTL